MKITLLINRARNNKIDKTQYLEFVDTLEGEYRTILDVDNPEFILKKNSKVPPTFNYVYIEELDSYYYVNHIDIVNHKYFSIDCKIDVLMTFRNYIYNLEAFVDRNEFSYDVTDADNVFSTPITRKKIVDDRIIVSEDVDFTDTVITNKVFNVDEESLNKTVGTFCLTGLGLSNRYIDYEE